MLALAMVTAFGGCSNMLNFGNDTNTGIEEEDTDRDEDSDDEDEDEESEDEKPEDTDKPEDEDADEPEEPAEPLEIGYEVGEQIPDFEFYDEDGNLHNISEFRGKAVYINFFTTWCTYCFYELPDMEEVYDKYSDDAVFIMIDLDEGPELGMQYADDYDVTIPIYYVNGWEVEGLEIEAIPLSIVIDANGVVHGNQLGQASLEWMDDAVKESIDSAK